MASVLLGDQNIEENMINRKKTISNTRELTEKDKTENIRRQSHLFYGKNTCKVVPKQQPSKAGWALELLRFCPDPGAWAQPLWMGTSTWSLFGGVSWVLPPLRAVCAQSSQPQGKPCTSSPTLQQQWETQQDKAEHFLKCWTSVLPETLQLHLLSMVRGRKEEFNSNQPIWPFCPKCPWYLSFHTQKPTSPTPQAPTEDPTTLSRFKCIKWLLFSPISCEYYTAFSARNLHSEFSGSGQIISDSCSEMQDLVTCSTIKLPWASSSPFLIFVQTPPLLHRQQPIFRVLPLHRERATGISNICSNKDSSLISTVSAYFKHQRFQQTNTSISFF